MENMVSVRNMLVNYQLNLKIIKIAFAFYIN